MRRVINVFMGLFVVLAFGMAGCGGGSSSSTPPATQTPSTVSTATFSAKSFNTEGGTLTFNANGTVSSVGFDTSNQTWSVNSSGQLIISGTSKGTATLTLSGNATSGWTGNMVYSNGTTETLILTPVTAPAVTGNVFTTAMISGKTFNSVSPDSSGVITFNADKTLTLTSSSGSGVGTWPINSSGQLVTVFTSNGEITTL